MKKIYSDRLIEKIDKEPQGKWFYHPSILFSAIAGAVIGGIIAGISVWMIVKGIIVTELPGQIAAGNPDATAILGIFSGIAIGGLFGSVYGTFAMLKERG
jgi:uncharacterized membrane protein YoaK (UPF0700 family)